jgi:hypothetical protein
LLFAKFAPDTKVFSSGNNFLHHVRASGETSFIHGYLINSYCFLTSEVTTLFWKQQLAIVTQLQLILLLSLIVAIVIPDHDGQSVKALIQGLTTAHWKVSSWDLSYLKIGNLVVDSCTVIIAIHSSSASVVEPLVLKTSPAVGPTQSDEFHLFVGDLSTYRLRCKRCGQRFTLHGSIGEILYHTPTAMLYHWNMIEPHDEQIHRESMLMPLLFASYENYV